MMRRLLLTCGLVMGLSLVAVPKASADSFDLNNIFCNCLPSGSSAGGTVNITGSGTLTVTVDLNDLLNFHYSSAFAIFAFSYDGPGALTLGTITTKDAGGNIVSHTGWDLVSAPFAKSNVEDGAGHSFNYAIDCPIATCSSGGGGISGVNWLQFTISVAGLTPAQIEILSGNNVDFAASVARTSTSGCTGVVGGGNGTGQSTAAPSSGLGGGTENCGVTVPDGGTTAGLLGLGMLGVAYLRRRLA